MKISKLFLAGLITILLPLTAYSQLSDRVNSPSTYNLGTRPIAGNYALQIGSGYQDIMDILDSNKDYEILPIVAFKYYNSNEDVFTLAFKSKKEKLSMKGTFYAPTDDFRYLNNQTQFMIVPGYEKHFGSGNILDFYIGARAPIGWEKDVAKQTVGALSVESKRNKLAYGLDAIIGLQAFIGDLPFAIGAEINYSLLGRLGDRYKVVTTGVGGRTFYYTDATNPVISTLDEFSDLSVNSMTIEGDVRVSLVYFFRR